MRGYLLDTNHLGQAVRRTSVVCQRVREARKSGHRIGTCIPVLCELEVGIQQVSQPEKYRKGLNRLLRIVRLWPIDRATAQHYGDVHLDLRQRGRVLSQVDMILAALARQMNLTLLTTDRDFEALPYLDVEDWTRS